MPCYDSALITTMVYNGWGRNMLMYLGVCYCNLHGHIEEHWALPEMVIFRMDLNIGACN